MLPIAWTQVAISELDKLNLVAIIAIAMMEIDISNDNIERMIFNDKMPPLRLVKK